MPCEDLEVRDQLTRPPLPRATPGSGSSCCRTSAGRRTRRSVGVLAAPARIGGSASCWSAQACTRRDGGRRSTPRCTVSGRGRGGAPAAALEVVGGDPERDFGTVERGGGASGSALSARLGSRRGYRSGMDPLAVDEDRLLGRRRGARRPPGGAVAAVSMRAGGSASPRGCGNARSAAAAGQALFQRHHFCARAPVRVDPESSIFIQSGRPLLSMSLNARPSVRRGVGVLAWGFGGSLPFQCARRAGGAGSSLGVAEVASGAVWLEPSYDEDGAVEAARSRTVLVH
jgi:hypothetical protein